MEPENIGVLRQKADTGISRVSLRDSQIVVPFILATSLCAVAGRVFLKLHYRRNLDVDDYFLLFGTICFIAATGLYYSMMDGLYISLLLGTEPELIVLLTPAQQIALFTGQLKMHAAFHFLVSTSIFAVKIGFLYFFRKIVQMRSRQYLFWKIVVLITVIFSLYFMIIPFIACPIFGPRAVVLIPLLVLRRAKADLRQKITVAIFLSVSSVMVFVAIVRVSTMRTSQGVFDYTWTNLWLYLEGGIAIIMISLSAFRTQYTLRREERQRQERISKPQTYYRPNRKQAPWLESEVEELPVIPEPTMSGLGGLIRGGNTHQSAMEVSIKDKPSKKKPGLSISIQRPESVYLDTADSDPFITSPSWLKTTHPTGPAVDV
ncbi:hypothetical protein K505DRAFT_338035 [Melanomma pulvis-pyrius CBS 109.77]|uniref:Rhodopsin domain-containing protein n=1 Tax=Melanomma pulvis-pyrius CBS 109.77 TaxID=1314802 RepID=A0A6A6XA86_9PLEO|nr:hypothetical protein K505DRAFT_338035 [Melanomma pulvis-pyrius CBS 109.77]